MIRRILASSMAILMTVAGAPAWAADCGDKAGAGGTRVACACGDTVITNATLKSGDPVVNAVCAGVGLSIGANDITLNCNGREISGDPDETGILLVDRTGVTVRTCRINGFFHGIRLFSSSGNTLLSNTITPFVFGITLEVDSDDNLVKSNRVVAPGLDAINLGSASGNRIVSNILDGAGSGGDGIDLDGLATGNTVKGNQVTGFLGTRDRAGLWGRQRGHRERSSGNGIGIRVSTLDANTIERNTTDNNESEGIEVFGNGHTIDRNRARRNGFNGITVSGNGNTVTRNTTDSNSGAGDRRRR